MLNEQSINNIVESKINVSSVIPTEKSPELTNFLEKVFGRSSSINKMKCVCCGQEAKQFKDEISVREYRISGLCQTCQDKTFGE